MDQAHVMKKEKEDWMRLYHKILKELKTMIDIQKIVKDIKKMAEEANIMTNQYSLPLRLSLLHLKLRPCGRQIAQHIS